MEWMLLPFRRYAEFSGRSRRKEYWMFILFNLIVYSILAGLAVVAGFRPWEAFGPEPTATIDDMVTVPAVIAVLALSVVYFLAVLVPSIAVSVRRLHDRDLSGWWYLAYIVLSNVPFVGAIVSIAFLVVTCLEGTRGPNRFGDDPKNPVGYDVFA